MHQGEYWTSLIPPFNIWDAGSGAGAQLVECLPSINEALYAPHKVGMVVHVCHAKTPQVKAGGSGVQGHS